MNESLNRQARKSRKLNVRKKEEGIKLNLNYPAKFLMQYSDRLKFQCLLIDLRVPIGPYSKLC